MWIVAKSIFWTSLGIFLFRGQFITSKTPKLLGRILYWIGVPLQIFILTRRSDFSSFVWFPGATAIAGLLIGLSLALLCLKIPQKLACDLDIQQQHRQYYPESKLVILFRKNVIARLKERSILEIFRFSLNCRDRFNKGSFILASMLGNTGFIGLAIAPSLIDRSYWNWIVVYGVAHNILGSYGLGVILANYFSYSDRKAQWRQQLNRIVVLPSLWAFVIGWLTKDIALPKALELNLQNATLFIIPGAFLLIGMQLSKIKKIDNWQVALFSTAIKIIILPLLTGIGLTLIGINGHARLALVLMSGMPTAFANIILAEEYNLNGEIAASSILLSTLIFPVVIPLWLMLF